MLEPFFTTKPHGNGLGLSICRTVLWEVDGTLTIRSEPGNGTARPRPRPAGGGPAAARTAGMRRARILIVDDEPGMLRAVERVLSEQHDVVGTRLSREALAMATSSTRTLRLSTSGCPTSTGSS